MCLTGQYLAQTKVGLLLCFIRFGATAAPLEPDLVWTVANTGGTKVRDHLKVVHGSCASAVMVAGRDII